MAASEGGGRPRRRPDPRGGLARRALLVLLLASALSALVAGRAVAAAPEPPYPPLVGPVPAIPPQAPDLPGSKHGKGGGGHKAKSNHGRGGRRGSGAKGGLELRASCAPFSHTQTYATWGPAVAYGAPVTVVYEATRCSTPDGSALDVAAEGTAKVFEGASADGALLDTRPFLVKGTWRQPGNAEGWPPAWWDCAVPYASYSWEIPGVYSFRVSAKGGVWRLEMSSQGVGSQAFSWSHDGCA